MRSATYETGRTAVHVFCKMYDIQRRLDQYIERRRTSVGLNIVRVISKLNSR
jgi:hypothetical protein